MAWARQQLHDFIQWLGLTAALNGFVAHTNKRLEQHDRWRTSHENYFRDEKARLQDDIDRCYRLLNDLHDEVAADRATRLESGRMDTAVILEGFRASSGEVARQVLSELLPALAPTRAALDEVRARLRALEDRVFPPLVGPGPTGPPV